jgi:hypothetical protein
MKSLRSAIAIAVLGTMLFPAQADNLKVDFAYLGVNYNYGPVTLSASAVPGRQLTASPFSVLNQTTNNSFAAFCLEPFQDLSGLSLGIGDTTYVSGNLTLPNSSAIQTLYDRYYAGALNSGTDAAAFQFALWELASDTGANLSTGPNFAMPPDAAVRALGQAMLDGVAVQSPALYSLVQWSSPSSQDLIQAIPVPEPGTQGLILAGLFGLHVWLRRRAGNGVSSACSEPGR